MLINSKKLISLILLCCMLFSFGQITNAQTVDPLRLRVEAALLVDGNSGKILYEKNSNQPLALASMTKMLTEYLILEQIKENKFSWEDTTRISDYAYKISQNLSLSNVPLRPDQPYSVRELYEAMAIYSANGATIALAELAAGTETEFVRLMNEKAKIFGLKNYRFVNSTGLNNKDLLGLHPAGGANEENTASAADTALVAFRLISDFPEALTISSIPRKTFRAGTIDAIKMDNWNWMLPDLVYAYEGMDGLKTGSTNLAGYCFTGTVKRDGLRLISVIMKSDSYATRFQETKKLLDYGFANFQMVDLFPAGFQSPDATEIRVTRGRESKVGIATEKPLKILIKRGENELYQPIAKLQSSKITAPVAKGQTVGRLVVGYRGEQDYKYLTAEGASKEEVPLVTISEVRKAGFFRRIIQSMGYFFSWLGDKISNLFSK
jgi:D-alanyl-D-alanine carboxypeptidase (penicillin-binding protein 5/6)